MTDRSSKRTPHYPAFRQDFQPWREVGAFADFDVEVRCKNLHPSLELHTTVTAVNPEHLHGYNQGKDRLHRRVSACTLGGVSRNDRRPQVETQGIHQDNALAILRLLPRVISQHATRRHRLARKALGSRQKGLYQLPSSVRGVGLVKAALHRHDSVSATEAQSPCLPASNSSFRLVSQLC
jgi:hypothetical protein